MSLEAIQQRHPSIYHHEDEYFKVVEKEGAKASETQKLEGEIQLLRATTLELMDKIRKGDAVGGYDKVTGEVIKFTDRDTVMAIKQLTDSIGKLTKIDYDIGSENVITWNSFKIWAASFARYIKEQFPDPTDQKKFVEASKKAGEPRRGGQ